MSRSYRKYKFRSPGKKILKEVYKGFEAANRMANKTLCYDLVMGKDVDYFIHYKKKHWYPFNIWCCYCEYPKGFHGNGFEMYDAILKSKDAIPWECYEACENHEYPSDRELEEVVANLNADDRAYYIRKVKYLYKK